MTDVIRKPIPKSILDESKLTLKAKSDKYPDTVATLKVSVLNNNPRITVFTGVKSEGNNGVIFAPMDGVTFYIFLETLSEVIAGPREHRLTIANHNVRDGEKKVISRTVIGKDVDGIVYLGLVAPDRAKFKFEFRISDWHQLVDASGKELPASETSAMKAKAWVNLMERLVSNVMTDQYTPYVPPTTEKKVD